MKDSYSHQEKLPALPLWDAMRGGRSTISFTIELTPRCNNNCRHCYVNLPANDREAMRNELPASRIMDIAGQAAGAGAIWCVLTGGEPLLRADFKDIYLGLKKKGLLVSVLTNGTLVNERYADLFKKYPPRDLEITVYGVTRETYETVTRKAGSYDAFMRGLDLLLGTDVKVRLKAMALRSNLHEMKEIAAFCRQRTTDYYRFDPQLHLRVDHDPVRNEEIRQERLTPEEIVELEQSDPERFRALEKRCDELLLQRPDERSGNRLFRCGTGIGNFFVGYNGKLWLCPSLCHKDCVYDLGSGTVADAIENFIPRIRSMQSGGKAYLDTCNCCPITDLCLWCPAHADLETGFLDSPVEYFCQVAHARARASGYLETFPGLTHRKGNV
jgi:radical SAM protein with 4Fe4S-binding SPASM domain